MILYVYTGFTFLYKITKFILEISITMSNDTIFNWSKYFTTMCNTLHCIFVWQMLRNVFRVDSCKTIFLIFVAVCVTLLNKLRVMNLVFLYINGVFTRMQLQIVFWSRDPEMGFISAFLLISYWTFYFSLFSICNSCFNIFQLDVLYDVARRVTLLCFSPCCFISRVQ